MIKSLFSCALIRYEENIFNMTCEESVTLYAENPLLNKSLMDSLCLQWIAHAHYILSLKNSMNFYQYVKYDNRMQFVCYCLSSDVAQIAVHTYSCIF